jgi:hypothetical protein
LRKSARFTFSRGWAHLAKQVKIQKKQAFDRAEQNRVSSAVFAEALRVANSKAEALKFLTAAGASFIVCSLLALYLIFAKIENNLRSIHEGIISFRNEKQ